MARLRPSRDLTPALKILALVGQRSDHQNTRLSHSDGRNFIDTTHP